MMRTQRGPRATAAMATVKPRIEWLKEDDETSDGMSDATSEWAEVIEATRTSPGFRNPLLATNARPITREMPALKAAKMTAKPRPLSIEMPVMRTIPAKASSESLDDDLRAIKPSFFGRRGKG